jgi:hypothetical protein
MVGSIARNAKKSFIEALDLDSERLDYCTSKHFYPSARELRSHWLLYRHGDYTPCAYYPSELLLSLTANNPDETAARERVMQAYADPITGAVAFMKLYREARRAGKPMSDIAPEPRHLNPIN